MKPIITTLIEEEIMPRVFSPGFLNKIGSLGDVRVLRSPGTLSEEELISAVIESSVIVTGWQSPVLPVQALTRLPQGENKIHICHMNGSIRKVIPEEYVNSDRFIITNWGTAVSKFVAETALTLMLSATRRLRYRFEEVILRDGWQGEHSTGGSLFNKRIGFYGFGAIAQCLVKLLTPFTKSIAYFDPYMDNPDPDSFTRYNNLDELFLNSDIITIHAGLTDETLNTVNRRRLEMLPDDAILINTARGKIINETDLIDVMKERSLWAGVDVCCHEPAGAGHPLKSTHKIIMTPHLGGKVGDSQVESISDVAYGNMEAFLHNRDMRFIISSDQFQRMT